MLKNYSKIKVNEDGDKFYLNDKGKEHRLDGSAIEYSDGTKLFVINKRDHRNIDPSVEWSDGEKRWYFNDKRHRIGGSYISYNEWWHIHGEQYSKQEYFNIVWDI